MDSAGVLDALNNYIDTIDKIVLYFVSKDIRKRIIVFLNVSDIDYLSSFVIKNMIEKEQNQSLHLYRLKFVKWAVTDKKNRLYQYNMTYNKYIYKIHIKDLDNITLKKGIVYYNF